MMGKEIERKFLINKDIWNTIDKPPGNILRQGYLLSDHNKTIRVRITNDNAYLTIKGATIGISRTEFEYEIPKNDAEELLNQFADTELNKTRYAILFEGKVWEIDVFAGENEGLIIAEIELNNENETFVAPNWLGIEVSDDAKYFNSYLAKHPFKHW